MCTVTSLPIRGAVSTAGNFIRSSTDALGGLALLPLVAGAPAAGVPGSWVGDAALERGASMNGAVASLLGITSAAAPSSCNLRLFILRVFRQSVCYS
jgi:hypothetical protein